MERMRAHESQSPQIDVNGNELLGLTCPRRTTHLDRYFQSVTAAGLGQQIAAVTFEAGVKSCSLEVEVVGSQIEQVTAEIIQPSFDPHQADLNWQQIERQVKLVELKMIKVGDNSSHYRLEYQDFD